MLLNYINYVDIKSYYVNKVILYISLFYIFGSFVIKNFMTLSILNI